MEPKRMQDFKIRITHEMLFTSASVDVLCMGFDLYYFAQQTTKGVISDSTSCVGGWGHEEIPENIFRN